MRGKVAVLLGVLIGLSWMTDAASLRIQRMGSSALAMKTWESSWSGSYDANVEQALRYTITLSGDCDECELLTLEVYYYGQRHSGSGRLPTAVAAIETFSVPACSSRKTLVFAQSPVSSIRKEKYYYSGARKYGVQITGVLVKLLRGKTVLKACTDVAGLGGSKLTALEPKVELDADFLKPAAHVIKAEWQKEFVQMPKTKDSKVDDGVAAREATDFSFMGVVFGDEYDSGYWTPPRRFGKFESYNKYVTRKSKKLYKLRMSYYSNSDDDANVELEYRAILEALTKKYGATPESMANGYSRGRRSVYDLGDIEIVLEKRGQMIELTVESKKFRELDEKERLEEESKTVSLDIDVL